MKTLIIGNFLAPNFNAPGLRVIGIAETLKLTGREVCLVGLPNEKPTSQHSTKLDGIEIHYSTRYSTIEYLFFIGRFYAGIIKKVREYKPDEIIFYGSINKNFIGLFRIYNLASKLGIKCIVDCVDLLPINQANKFMRFAKRIDEYLQKEVLYKKIGNIIAISSRIELKYLEMGCQTLVVPPIIAKAMISCKIPKSITSGSINKKNDFLFCYSGNPFSMNGEYTNRTQLMKDRLDIVIDCLYLLKKYNFKFNVVGLSKKQYLSAIPWHSSILREMKDKINFLGRVPHHQAVDVVASSAYFLLYREQNPGNQFGYPTKVVESLANGVTVITTDTSDLKKHQQHEPRLIVTGCDIQSYVSALKSVMDGENIVLESKNTNLSIYSKYRHSSALGTFLDTI